MAKMVKYTAFRPILGISLPLKTTPALYTTNEVHPKGLYSLKFSKNSTTRKKNNFLLLWNGNAQNVPKSPISGHLTYFRTPNPKDDPLYYHGSTFRGSYFPESLHKFILPENIFISYFCAMKMHKMYPKVVYPVILTYFRTP